MSDPRVDGLRLHHLGVACRDLDEGRALESLGFAPEGEDFEDPLQGIRGRFYAGPGLRLEFVSELAGSDVLKPWLTHGSRVYHQAFETSDLDGRLNRLVEAGARVTRQPMPAVAFGGRRVAFVMLPNLMLIELVESPPGN